MLELRQHVSYLELAGADAALCVALQKCCGFQPNLDREQSLKRELPDEPVWMVSL